MIETHLEKLQSTLEQAAGLPEDTRTELLSLIATIREETSGHAENATADTDVSGTDITGLMASVEKLEASHPELAALINQVAMALSRMGI